MIRRFFSCGIQYHCKASQNLWSRTFLESICNQRKENMNEHLKAVNRFVNRTHTCGELTLNNVNERVKLCGWLEYHRVDKFIILRDSYGSTQCIFDIEKTISTIDLKKLTIESVLSISGIVIPRPTEQRNSKLKTGDIEIYVESLNVLNASIPKLPFAIRSFSKAKEFTQMQYRYLALRFYELQRNLRLRSTVIMKMREYLINKCGFVDITTPTLFRKTPGGAQEFVVPSRHKEKFYSLVQSPQQFKQLLMVGGMDRYFQVAQCYRDEGARSDRQPEFSQLDIEMSFVDKEHLMSIVEELIVNSWPEFLGKLRTPFLHLQYEEAMEMFGTDCPDLRIPGRIYNLTESISINEGHPDQPFGIYGTIFSNKKQFLTRSINQILNKLSEHCYPKVKLTQFCVSNLNLTELDKLFPSDVKNNILNKMDLRKDDILFLTYGPKFEARELLNKIRTEFANILESKGEVIRCSGYYFAWITDFPLFTIDDTKGLKTTHHPFTQPYPDDVQHLLTNPSKVRGLQYDLVLNGIEIGGGSIRIHNKNLQEQILQLLNIDASDMYYLMEALDSGAPPHGGFALGLDRYISILCGASSIREVIAFPKTMEGRDLMSGAPTTISEKDKQLYHL